VTDVVEEALLRLWRQVWPPLRRDILAFLERTADMVRPDPPLYMRTLDGETVTGIVILERGQAVAFLGTRHPAASRPPPHHRYPNDFDDEPLWDRRGQPFGR
jgi:hypothetical protein